MKTKFLTFVLVLFCAIFLFQAGYFLGSGRLYRRAQLLLEEHSSPLVLVHQPQLKRSNVSNVALTPSKTKPVVKGQLQPQSAVSGRGGYFFATAMTSKETDQAHIVSISLPGLSKEAIDIEVNGRQLLIQAKQNKENKIDKKGFYKEELSSVNFVQTLTLPLDVKAQDISAEYNWEVVTITMPKDKKSKGLSVPKMKIPIK